MLTIHDFANATYEPWPGSNEIPEHAYWIDARSPTEEESAFLKRALGVTPPTLAMMSEIEWSSRLYRMKDAVCATVPLPHRETGGHVSAHPLALIVTPKALLTVRYEDLKPCQPEYLEAIGIDRAPASPLGATIAVLEGIVDHLADELELVSARLDDCSRQIFVSPQSRAARKRRSDLLKRVIPDIGRHRELCGSIEETLLVLTRAAPYLESEFSAVHSADTRMRIDRIGHDVQSLNSHASRLSDKIQFMLDASLGLIGVEQNDMFKVLTIVSVIGIPPTLIASMYGMNFKTMPELDWAWGYPYALTLIALSIIIPLGWFKWRRWW